MQAIASQRLRLVPLSLDDAAAMLEGRTPHGAEFADGYPADSTLIAAAIVVKTSAEGGDLGPWRLYQVVHEGRVVGGMGFIEALDRTGSVRVGFSETAEARSAALTEEALAALIAYARTQGAKRIRAEAGQARIAEVLEAAGMRQVGGCGDGLLLYEA